VSIHTPLDTSTVGALDAWLFDSVGWPLVVGLVLLACALLTRLPWATELGSDFYTQVWWQRQFRRSKAWLRPQFQDSVASDPATFYPPFPASLLARLPEKLVVPSGVLANYGCDAAHAGLVYGLLVYNDIHPSTALLAAVLWVVMPILFPVNARLVGLGARTVGPLLHSGYLIGIYLALSGHPMTGTIVSLLCGTATFFTSQFGVQSLVLQSLGLSAAYLNVLPATILALSAVAVLLLGGREALRLKLVHVRHYMQHGRRFLADRNSFSALRRTWKRHPLLAIPYCFTSTTIGVLLVGMIGVVPIALSVDLTAVSTDIPLLRFSLAVAGIASVGVIATMKGPLEVLGEAERYMEYASPFVIVAAVLASAPNSPVYLSLLLGIVLALLGTYANLSMYLFGKIVQVMRLDHASGQVTEVHDLLRRHGAARIATAPMSLSSILSVTSSGEPRHTYLHYLLWDRCTQRFPWSSSPSVFPHLDTRPEFLDSYGINAVVFERRKIGQLQGANGIENLTHWDRVDTPEYVLFFRPHSEVPGEASQIADRDSR